MAPRRLLLASLPIALTAITAAVATAAVAENSSSGADATPVQQLRALQVLPPGESGFFSVQGQAQGTLSNDPGAYGDHVDDQRATYWGYRYNNGGFTRQGTPQEPKQGVQVYRDSQGVPSVYGDNGRDVWWGAGWAAAQDRLFEMDAIRRLAEGRLAELTGPSSVPDDIATRVLTYSKAEYAAQFARLPQSSKDAVEGYVDGANTWISAVRSDPSKLPAEYVLLSSLPEPLTTTDVLAMGVFMTRVVASQGGGEMDNASALGELVQKFGSAAGRKAFDDLFWRSDPKATTTVPASEGTFSNDDTPPAQRARTTDAIESWALKLPAGLAKGNGTGDAPAPTTAPPTETATALPDGVRASLAKAVDSLVAWGRGLHGGSYQIAVSPKRTKDGHALLESAPQLGWSYPSELYVQEVHGGGYDARGATVPGLPVIGIGYGKRVAWALTTGYSKTIDSFVETTRENPAGKGAPRQFLHDGKWLDESCRTETVSYRPAVQGVPFGPALQTVDVPVCRTLHGPVVASAGNLERSVQYAMWDHEVDTINGVLQWDRAQNLQQFEAGMRQVTWNENTMYADADGHIAYWHPGRYPVRSPLADQRFPAPGTGAYDWRGLRAWKDMPHVVDPEQGWLANWNNLPAVGWNTGDATAAGGPFDHVGVPASQLAHGGDLTLPDLVRIDNHVGNSDARTLGYLPLLKSLARTKNLSSAQRAALTLLSTWDGQASDYTAGVAKGGKDPVAATLFDAYVTAIRARLFASLPADLVKRDSAVSLHLYDVTPLDNLALRILDPSSSGLRPSRDYLHGASPRAAQLAALDDAMAALAKQFGTSDMSRWRRDHPTSNVCSLTGVIGPCVDMPYEDRGSYIHLVGFVG